MNADLLNELKKAVVGMTYPSETDAPFEVVTWPAGPADARSAVSTNASVPAGAKVEIVSLADFFAELERDEYVRLRKIFEQLENAGVVRVGEVRVAVYVVGKMAGGTWVGVKTLSVET